MNRPQRNLSVLDAVAIVMGVVIGAGIFRTPSLVAANTSDWVSFLLVWVAGGVISLIGALCYAELASAYPDAGGDYHFLSRAYGNSVGFLFAWARMTVIQTGSIALQAFVIGDYAAAALGMNHFTASLVAGVVILTITGLNLMGILLGKTTQRILAGGLLLALGVIVAVGAFGVATNGQPASFPHTTATNSIGLAMVFVLLTYGGWNEAAYLSAEVKGGQRAILKVLVWSIAIVTITYLLVNVVLLLSLGMPAMAASQAVATDMVAKAIGPVAGQVISLIIIVAALSTVNATIITGARTNYAFGRDCPAFGRVGTWDERAGVPVGGLILQGLIAMALVLFGTVTRQGFQTMVEYTAPVFWGFFLLAGISLFVLRRRDPGTHRPFKVPLYPLTPLIFCGVCAYMLQSSIAYTGIGAWVGVAVVAAGVPLLLLARVGRAVPQEPAS